MKLFLTYVAALTILLGVPALLVCTFVYANMIPSAEAKATVSTPDSATSIMATRIMAKSDERDEPVVDPNDPTLFDARGQFPAAMREAMAKTRRDSIRDYASVRAEYIKAAKEAKERKAAQRRPVRRGPAPIEAGNPYEQAQQSYQEQARRQESWNNGGFGFGF